MHMDFTAPPIVFRGQGAPEVAYRTAYDLLSRRAPHEALSVLESALEQEPDDTGLRTLRVWAYLQRAQLDLAETELRELAELHPGDTWFRHALGRTLERQSKQTEALGHLRLAYAMSGDPLHAADLRRVEIRIGSVG